MYITAHLGQLLSSRLLSSYLSILSVASAYNASQLSGVSVSVDMIDNPADCCRVELDCCASSRADFLRGVVEAEGEAARTRLPRGGAMVSL
jgi:hypothetical protein